MSRNFIDLDFFSEFESLGHTRIISFYFKSFDECVYLHLHVVEVMGSGIGPEEELR